MGALFLCSTVLSRLLQPLSNLPLGTSSQPLFQGEQLQVKGIMGLESRPWGQRQGRAGTQAGPVGRCTHIHEHVHPGGEVWAGVHLPADTLLPTAQALLLLSPGLRLRGQLLLRMIFLGHLGFGLKCSCRSCPRELHTSLKSVLMRSLLKCWLGTIITHRHSLNTSSWPNTPLHRWGSRVQGLGKAVLGQHLNSGLPAPQTPQPTHRARNVESQGECAPSSQGSC